MKKLLFTSLCLLLGFQAFAQRGLYHKIPYFQWSNETVFKTSMSPLVTGFGPASQVLSEANGGADYYEVNGEYMPIKTWADYYLWYTLRFPQHFSSPSTLYEYFYQTQNNLGMATFVATEFTGDFYPTKVLLDFRNMEVPNSRLCSTRALPSRSQERSLANGNPIPINKGRVIADPQRASRDEDFGFKHRSKSIPQNGGGKHNDFNTKSGGGAVTPKSITPASGGKGVSKQ